MSDEENKEAENTENPGEDNTEEDDIEEDEDLLSALDGEIQGSMSMENMDKLIGEEDPLFQDEISKIKPDDFAGLIIDDKQASAEVDEKVKAPPMWKSYLKNLPKQQKRIIYSVGGVLVMGVGLIYLLLAGYLLPSFGNPYVMSMNDITETVYTYPLDGVQVPLFDDYRSKAFTYGLPKTLINLKTMGGKASYGEFEFFLNLRDEDMAEIVKNKQSEVMDLIQRTLEQISWKELQTPVGKEKVKKVIRHRVNDYLQGNLVLGVYYRSIVLQK